MAKTPPKRLTIVVDRGADSFKLLIFRGKFQRFMSRTEVLLYYFYFMWILLDLYGKKSGFRRKFPPPLHPVARPPCGRGRRHGRHRVNYEFEDDCDEELNDLIGNSKLNEQFLKLAQDLDVMEAKTPEDIYKSHLAETGGFSRCRDTNGTQVDSARANLASTFVNAFVNAGFGEDKLMTNNPDNEWLYKNKDHGMMSAAASLGSTLLWNVDEGLAITDKFLYSSEEYVKAGAALAVGILSSGVRNDADPIDTVYVGSTSCCMSGKC